MAPEDPDLISLREDTDLATSLLRSTVLAHATPLLLLLLLLACVLPCMLLLLRGCCCLSTLCGAAAASSRRRTPSRREGRYADEEGSNLLTTEEQEPLSRPQRKGPWRLRALAATAREHRDNIRGLVPLSAAVAAGQLSRPHAQRQHGRWSLTADADDVWAEPELLPTMPGNNAAAVSARSLADSGLAMSERALTAAKLKLAAAQAAHANMSACQSSSCTNENGRDDAQEWTAARSAAAAAPPAAVLLDL